MRKIEKLWRALIEPEFTLQYWGIGLRSDWKAGSPVLLQWGPGEEFHDVGQVVLESDPYRRLSYRWHTTVALGRRRVRSAPRRSRCSSSRHAAGERE